MSQNSPQNNVNCIKNPIDWGLFCDIYIYLAKYPPVNGIFSTINIVLGAILRHIYTERQTVIPNRRYFNTYLGIMEHNACPSFNVIFKFNF